MARGKTLENLLDDLRAEARLSLNPAHNSQVLATQIKHLQRVQEWLWGDFDWPHLRVFRPFAAQAGQRYYEPPADLDIDRITMVEVRWDGVLTPVCPGIGAEQYAAYDSELDQRSSPVQRWQITEDEQMELWPIPDGNADSATLEGYIRVTGIKRLAPFVASADRADLDDRLIVLYAAAELLAASGAKDAQLKLDQANKRYAKLRGHLMPRRKFDMFGVGRYERVKRVPFAVYNKPSS